MYVCEPALTNLYRLEICKKLYSSVNVRPAKGQTMRWLPTSVRRPSVCHPFRGHISKTKQDRPTVAMEYCIISLEGGIADSIAA